MRLQGFSSGLDVGIIPLASIFLEAAPRGRNCDIRMRPNHNSGSCSTEELAWAISIWIHCSVMRICVQLPYE
jgi:hypothetical protein